MEHDRQNVLNNDGSDRPHYERVQIVNRWQTAVRVERILSGLCLAGAMIGVFKLADAVDTTLAELLNNPEKWYSGEVLDWIERTTGNIE